MKDTFTRNEVIGLLRDLTSQLVLPYPKNQKVLDEFLVANELLCPPNFKHEMDFDSNGKLIGVSIVEGGSDINGEIKKLPKLIPFLQ